MLPDASGAGSRLPWREPGRRPARLDQNWLVATSDYAMLYDSPAPPAGILLLRAFFDRERAAIAAAAELLGGRPARERALRLATRISDAPRMTALLRRELVALLRLLSLDEVDDPYSDAAGFFAGIDPADPAVHNICRLSEAFETTLAALDAAPDVPSRREAA
ncbi:hypothetical protein DDV93_22340 [Cereibacter johrii]|nr:hypothetical protein DDV93_22340 [Cereibacter johrii]